MRGVMVNPSSIPNFLETTLKYLVYKEVMNHFGMFFLHDFDVDNMDLVDQNIGVEDGAAVKAMYGKALALFSRSKKVKKQPKHLQFIDSAANEECPWEEVLTLARVKKLLIQI
jgi:hypothetical protein